MTPTGQFDRAQFERSPQCIGFSEQRFFDEQRASMLRREIIGRSPATSACQKHISTLSINSRTSSAAIEYVALGPEQAGDIPQPTAEELTKYFNDRKILFRAPEYRKVVTVVVTPADWRNRLRFPMPTPKSAMTKPKQFHTPERRHIEQIVFPTMAEAQAAERTYQVRHEVRCSRRRARPERQATSISGRWRNRRSSIRPSLTPRFRSSRVR